MTPNINNPKAISEKGEAIYNERYRAQLEADHIGQFAAVNILDESVTLGETGSSALLKAKMEHPSGLFHLIRIGHAGAFEVGLAYRNVVPGRLHR